MTVKDSSSCILKPCLYFVSVEAVDNNATKKCPFLVQRLSSSSTEPEATGEVLDLVTAAQAAIKGNYIY